MDVIRDVNGICKISIPLTTTRTNLPTLRLVNVDLSIWRCPVLWRLNLYLYFLNVEIQILV